MFRVSKLDLWARVTALVLHAYKDLLVVFHHKLECLLVLVRSALRITFNLTEEKWTNYDSNGLC